MLQALLDLPRDLKHVFECAEICGKVTNISETSSGEIAKGMSGYKCETPSMKNLRNFRMRLYPRFQVEAEYSGK